MLVASVGLVLLLLLVFITRFGGADDTSVVEKKETVSFNFGLFCHFLS